MNFLSKSIILMKIITIKILKRLVTDDFIKMFLHYKYQNIKRKLI
jgi:hypothetical protein